MGIREQRVRADIILAKLETIDPHAMLAGGAPRDWSFGREADDLDFYIHLRNLSITDFHKQLYDFGLLREPLYPSDQTIYENYRETSAVRWVVSVRYEGCKLQIVVMHKPVLESVLQHFSLSICNVWYKNQTMRITDAFSRTVEEKTMRQVQEAFGSGYVSKILAKFPDYAFIPLTYDYEKPIPF